MKRSLCLLALLFALFLPRIILAQVSLGQTVATFAYAPSKVLADPLRSQVYMADVPSKSVVVVDTTTLRVIAAIPVAKADSALSPVDMAISLDTAATPENLSYYGDTLYVAAGGTLTASSGAAATANIVAINLKTLTVRDTFPIQGVAPLAIAAGLKNRVFFTAIGSNTTSSAYQLDGTPVTGGAIQATFDVNFAGVAGALQISPNGTTLFVASGQTQGSAAGLSNLRSYNVTGFTPGIMQTFSAASINGEQLAVSHTGAYVCLPGTGGNFANMGVSTVLFSAANINTLLGAFNNGTYPGLVAFSPTDALVYQTRSSGGSREDLLDVFDTKTSARVDEVPLPVLTASGRAIDFINTVTVDHTGSYLFIGGSNTVATATGTTVSGQVAVIGTGAGTLAPPVAPTITGDLAATATVGTAFTYQITASGAPTSFAAVGLPGGLSVDNATGLISGTPAAAGTFTVALTANNLSGQGSAALTLTVDDVVVVAPTLPVIALAATIPTVTVGSGEVATVTLTRTGDLSAKLFVLYSVGGTAQGGVDYVALSGQAKFKPGKDTAIIKIVPLDSFSGDMGRNVKLKLSAGAAYQFSGTTKKAKVSILPAE